MHHLTKTYILFLTSALDEGVWSASRSNHFISRENSPQYPLYRMLGEPQNRSGPSGKEKISCEQINVKVNGCYSAIQRIYFKKLQIQVVWAGGCKMVIIRHNRTPVWYQPGIIRAVRYPFSYTVRTVTPCLMVIQMWTDRIYKFGSASHSSRAV
jgi:hypothetical protein